jgi:hypothetical protein
VRRERVHGEHMRATMTKRFGSVTGTRGTSIRFGYRDAGNSGACGRGEESEGGGKDSRMNEPVFVSS